jgi:hypothetical protein
LNSQFSCLPQPKFTKKPVKEFTFDGKTWIRTGVKYIKPSFTSDSISTVVYTLKNEKKLNLSELTQNISISKNYTSNNFIKKETSISIWYQNTQKMLDQNSDTHSLIYPIENFSNQYGEGFSFGYVENSNPFVPRYKYQIKIGEDYYTFEFSEISEESKDNAYKFVKDLKKAKEVEGDNLKVEDVIARFQTLVDQNLALAKQNSEKTKQTLLSLIPLSPKDQHNFKKSEIGIDLRN